MCPLVLAPIPPRPLALDATIEVAVERVVEGLRAGEIPAANLLRRAGPGDLLERREHRDLVGVTLNVLCGGVTVPEPL